MKVFSWQLGRISGWVLSVLTVIVITVPTVSLIWLLRHYASATNFAHFGTDCEPSTQLLTSLYVGVTVTSQILIGTAMASIVYFWAWGRNGRLVLATTILVIPYAIPSTIAYTLFEFVFGVGGSVDALLGPTLGMNAAVFSGGWSRFVIMCLVGIWQFFPFAFVVILAAFLAVPRKMIAAARADGARPERILREILLPAAMPVIAAAFFLRMILMLTKVDAPLAFASTSSGDYACLAAVRIYQSIGAMGSAMPLGIILTLAGVVAILLVLYLVAMRSVTK